MYIRRRTSSKKVVTEGVSQSKVEELREEMIQLTAENDICD